MFDLFVFATVFFGYVVMRGVVWYAKMFRGFMDERREHEEYWDRCPEEDNGSISL